MKHSAEPVDRALCYPTVEYQLLRSVRICMIIGSGNAADLKVFGAVVHLPVDLRPRASMICTLPGDRRNK
jgi:hypothetical protein